MLSKRPSQHGLGSSYTYSANLRVTDAEMKVGLKPNFKPVIKGGSWAVKGLGLRADDRVIFRVRVVGDGAGYLYASFLRDGQRFILDVCRVTSGTHQLSFTVPFNTLNDFKIGIMTTVPHGYKLDMLSKEKRYQILTNSMTLVTPTPPMYESQGIGFAGLGNPVQTHLNRASNMQYWDGNLDNHNWSTHGFSGEKAHPATNPTSNANVPKVAGAYHGYYSFRCSYYIATFNANNQFTGWRPLQSVADTMTAPAGIPIAVVFQFFILRKKVSKDKDAGDRATKSPSWFPLRDEKITGLKIVNPELNSYAGNRMTYTDTSPRWDDGDGPVTSVPRGWVTPDWTIDGSNKDIPGFAVEWYRPSIGDWGLSNSAGLSEIPATNQDGKTMAVFRFPRQLNQETDKDILDQLSALNVTYDYRVTKKCYPVSTAPWKAAAGANTDVGYALIGRPETDGDTVFNEDGVWYVAPKFKTQAEVIFKFPRSPYAGVAGNDQGYEKPGWVTAWTAGTLKLSDSEKMARMNNPKLYNAFYPLDGFKTGSVVIAIGRSLSTSSVAALATTQMNPFDATAGNASTSKIGSSPSCRFKPTGLILASDLMDDRTPATEQAVLDQWQEKFGVPLNRSFFERIGENPATRLQDQVNEPGKRHLYEMTDPTSGLKFRAPYQIMFFKIDPTYCGPYVEYTTQTTEAVIPETQQIQKTTKLVVNKPQGVPYAMGAGDMFYLNVRTPYGYYTAIPIEIVAEVQQQVQLMDQGLTSEDQLLANELDEEPINITDEIYQQDKEEEYQKDLALWEERQAKAAPRSRIAFQNNVKYVKPGSLDRFRFSPQYYATQADRDNVSINGIGAFTNSRDFYVEDVTQKWGGLSGASNVIDTETGLLPHNGLGAATDGFFDEIKEPINDLVLETSSTAFGALRTASVMTFGTWFVFKAAGWGAEFAKKALRD